MSRLTSDIMNEDTAFPVPDYLREILELDLPSEAIVSRQLRDDLSQIVELRGGHAIVRGLNGLLAVVGIIARRVVDLELRQLKPDVEGE